MRNSIDTMHGSFTEKCFTTRKNKKTKRKQPNSTSSSYRAWVDFLLQNFQQWATRVEFLCICERTKRKVTAPIWMERIKLSQGCRQAHTTSPDINVDANKKRKYLIYLHTIDRGDWKSRIFSLYFLLLSKWGSREENKNNNNRIHQIVPHNQV